MTTTITLNWSPVTTKSDGTPVTSPISKYVVQYYTGSTPLTGNQPLIDVPAGSTSTTITDVPNGLMGVRVLAVDSSGNQSEWSPYSYGDTTDIAPASPGSVTATFSP